MYANNVNTFSTTDSTSLHGQAQDVRDYINFVGTQTWDIIGIASIEAEEAAVYLLSEQ